MRLYSLLTSFFILAAAGTALSQTNFYSSNTTIGQGCTYQQSGYAICVNDPTPTMTQITMPTSFTNAMNIISK
ncbi:15078_t:CDS:1, partial [Dentiscutata heterogama]